MTIQVSTGSSVDLESIMPVMQSAFPSAYGEAWTLTQCAGALALSGAALFIARSANSAADAPSGFAIVRTILDEAELLLIAVDPDHQRLGIGARLLALVCETSANIGVRTLHVEVRHDNPALAFYISEGFDKAGERLNYYRRTDGQVGTAVTLVKKIA